MEGSFVHPVNNATVLNIEAIDNCIIATNTNPLGGCNYRNNGGMDRFECITEVEQRYNPYL